MNLLVVGDVHGCVHTLKAFVKNHWTQQDEFLILVGDVINKGRHSAKTVKYLRKLQKEFPYSVFFFVATMSIWLRNPIVRMRRCPT